jgi:hypothetical protein
VLSELKVITLTFIGLITAAFVNHFVFLFFPKTWLVRFSLAVLITTTTLYFAGVLLGRLLSHSVFRGDIVSTVFILFAFSCICSFAFQFLLGLTKRGK